MDRLRGCQDRARMLVRSLAVALAVAVVGCGGARPRPEGEPRAARTLLLVSLDGFRWDYGRLAPTPNIDALARRGVRAERLIPVFPTKTFPNHYTIVTGLYPGHHGIVANNVRDPLLGSFSMSNRAAVADARWWGGEPLWVTLEKNGRRAAPLFWPGSEAAIGEVRPSEWRGWDEGKTEIPGRLAWVLERLRRPLPDRPACLSFYTEVVDTAGHRNPIGSPAVAAAIVEADRAVGELVRGIAELGLTDQVDLVVLADHGMTAVSPQRTVFLEDLIPLHAIDVVDWNPLLSAFPMPGHEADEIRRALASSPHLTVTSREASPPAWRYRGSPRVPPILALADEGWQIASRCRLGGWPPGEGGNHGYDPHLPSMGALFVAAGPSFRQGVVVAPFENVHLYELFCRILGVPPAPNDGDLNKVRGLLRPGLRTGQSIALDAVRW
jgi:predicted AlkP superfamily pyrophosphatase or phosphodiesterase